jgi:hypothetical protein
MAKARGFVVVGRIRKHIIWQDRKWVNLIFVGVLDDEWK